MNFPYSPTDLFDYAPMTKADTQIFTSNNFNINWSTWTKPRGATMCYMFVVGGGGGGGGGFTRASNNQGGGGGGGASSGLARLMVPAFFLPDVLYIQVGAGGIGGSGSGVAGGAGTNSYISLGHSTALPNVLLASGVNAPGGGGAGTGAAGGTAGSIPTIAVTTTAHQNGFWFAFVGAVGTIGGSGAVGTDVTAWGTGTTAGNLTTPGASGGGTQNANFRGGRITAGAVVDWSNRNWPTTAGFLVPSGDTGAINGGSGISSLQPYFNTGGAGGAGIDLTRGGDGGKGGIGGGGGGGGAGTTGGAGGSGGNGIVAIISW